MRISSSPTPAAASAAFAEAVRRRPASVPQALTVLRQSAAGLARSDPATACELCHQAIAALLPLLADQPHALAALREGSKRAGHEPGLSRRAALYLDVIDAACRAAAQASVP